MILEQALREWDDPYAVHEDINYYRKDWKDQMIQDQGLEE